MNYPSGPSRSPCLLFYYLYRPRHLAVWLSQFGLSTATKDLTCPWSQLCRQNSAIFVGDGSSFVVASVGCTGGLTETPENVGLLSHRSLLPFTDPATEARCVLRYRGPPCVPSKWPAVYSGTEAYRVFRRRGPLCARLQRPTVCTVIEARCVLSYRGPPCVPSKRPAVYSATDAYRVFRQRGPLCPLPYMRCRKHGK